MTPGHPSEYLSVELLETIRKFGGEAEKQRDLHPEQLKIIYEHAWFKMFVPKSYGGLNISLPQALRIEEALAWADGSTAWVVTLCSGAAWFIGFLEPALSNTIFMDSKVCIAGSGAPNGTAEINDMSYTINGEWKYASGSLHAQAFTANCVITRKGKPLLDGKGGPLIKAFIFYKNEVEIERSWNTMGMVATGSHGFKIRELEVPLSRAFEINKAFSTLKEPLYQYPFLQFAEATLAVNYSGMALRFLELAKPLIKSQDTTMEEHFQLHHHAAKNLQVARTNLYAAVDSSWLSCSATHTIADDKLITVSATSHALYLASLIAVNTVYPSAGLTAANPDTEINRVWRNIFTASQHSLFATR